MSVIYAGVTFTTYHSVEHRVQNEILLSKQLRRQKDISGWDLIQNVLYMLNTLPLDISSLKLNKILYLNANYIN